MRNTRGIAEIDKFPKAGEGINQSSSSSVSNKIKNMIDRYLSEENSPLVGGRIIIIGSAAVGKSCLMKRYFQGDFTDNYKVTIGVDFGQKELNVFGIEYKIQVFDTAGEEKFRSLAEQYYRNADCVLVCFDLGDMDSLGESRRWAQEARQFCNTENVRMILVGCKSDRLKVCEKEDIQRVYEIIKGEYFETSALSNVNVDEVFNRAAYLVFERILQSFYRKKEAKKGGDDFSVDINKPKQNGGGGGGGCKCK